jgi:hypothetical protein
MTSCFFSNIWLIRGVHVLHVAASDSQAAVDQQPSTATAQIMDRHIPYAANNMIAADYVI